MEKIYEEKFNQNPNNGKMYKFSIVLSFCVAVFAVVSLIAFGFNQISFAAPIEGTTAEVKVGRWGDATTDTPAQIIARNGGSGTITPFAVPMLFTDNINAATAVNPVFCVERDITEYGSTYNKGDSISDIGLIYIMNHSYLLNSASSGFIPGDYKTIDDESLTANQRKYLEIFATQVAMWVYLYETGAENNTITAAELAMLKGSISEIYTTDTVGGANLASAAFYDTYIKDIVEAAKTATNLKTIRANLTDRTISKVDDGKIYQTAAITAVATPSDDLLNYSVSISGLDGAYIVDEDGNTKTEADTFAPGAKFFVRVPVDKVTETATTANIRISGLFTNYVSGNYFVATGKQTIIAVTSPQYRVSNNFSVDFAPIPDTGMSTSQTIYFIGLIVLLCGVGIVYANAKPVETE